MYSYIHIYITRLECSLSHSQMSAYAAQKKNTWNARSRLEYWWISCRIRSRDDDRARPATGDRAPGLYIYINMYICIYI